MYFKFENKMKIGSNRSRYLTGTFQVAAIKIDSYSTQNRSLYPCNKISISNVNTHWQFALVGDHPIQFDDGIVQKMQNEKNFF